MYDRLLDFVNKFDRLYALQYGFRKKQINLYGPIITSR